MLPDDAVSVGALREVVTAFDDPGRLEQAIEAWDTAGLSDLVSRLRDFVSEIDPAAVPAAVRVIARQAHRRIPSRAAVDDPSREVPWLLADLVELLPATARDDFFTAWAAEDPAPGHHFRVYDVARYETRSGRPLASEPILHVLRAALAQSTRNADAAAVLAEPWAGRIIWLTSEILAESDADVLREWLESSDALFARYLLTFTGVSFGDKPQLAWQDIGNQVGQEWATDG